MLQPGGYSLSLQSASPLFNPKLVDLEFVFTKPGLEAGIAQSV